MTQQTEFHELILETAGRLLEAEQHFDAAWNTITNSTAGYRSSTIPAPGSGSSGDSTHPERYETINADVANVALAELKVAIREAFARASSIARLVSTWTPGLNTSAKHEPLDPTDWCSSCLRIAKCTPRHRGDLCRWCYDFHAANKRRLPPIELVRMHHEGRRITDEQVKAALSRRAS